VAFKHARKVLVARVTVEARVQSVRRTEHRKTRWGTDKKLGGRFDVYHLDLSWIDYRLHAVANVGDQLDFEREASPRGDRVEITMSGKFLPYKYWGNEQGIPDDGLKETS
jgi:Cyanate lyase C-terminal domain